MINGNKWEASPNIPDTMPDIATIIFNTTSECISQMKMFLEIKSTRLLATTINKVNKNISKITNIAMIILSPLQKYKQDNSCIIST